MVVTIIKTGKYNVDAKGWIFTFLYAELCFCVSLLSE